MIAKHSGATGQVPRRRIGLLLSLAVSATCPLAASPDTTGTPDLSGSAWIWSSRQALIETRDVQLFRKKFTLPAKPEEATIVLTADNSFDLYINGRFVAGDGGVDGAIWKSVERFRVESQLLQGANVIAVEAENLGGPGGFIASARIRLPDGATRTLVTDASWLSSPQAVPGWTEADHDDSLWKPAVVLGELGTAPWGDLVIPGGVSVVKRRRSTHDLFTEAPEDYPWPAGVVFVSGEAPLDSTPGAPQSKWPVRGSKAFFEHDSPMPAALGHKLHALVPARPETRPRLLLDAGSGLIGSPIASYDGAEVIFTLAPEGEKFFKIFRIARDGSGLRRLTSGPWHDYDPALLPDGRIVFASTRIGSREEYHGNTARSLFCLDADRTSIRPLTYHIVGDSGPVITADGRIAFVRADNFMERAKVETHIHVCDPDGTSAAVLVGPDRGRIAYDHVLAAEDPALWLRNLGFGSPAPLPDGRLACLSHAGPILTGPELPGAVSMPSDVSLFDISPLPDGRLLCSTVHGGALGVLDPRTGRTVLLYRSEARDLHSVVYLGERPKPPILPGRPRSTHEGAAESAGYLLCLDAYAGQQTAADWERVRAVRVYMGDPMTTRAARHPYGHIGTVGVELGTVPLAEDGSFYVRVPADRALAIQAVDAEGRSVVNELSWIYVRPGETSSCTGCHGPRGRTPESRSPLASRIDPVDLLPSGMPHRFRANNAANGGVLNLQFDRFREAASIDLYPQPPVSDGEDPTRLAGGRSTEVSRLAHLLASAESPTRVSAARRLAILRDRSAVPSLATALGDRDTAVRLAAALALAACGDRRAVAPLLEALDDPNPLVARASHIALVHLTGHQPDFEAFSVPAGASRAASWTSWLANHDWAAIENELVARLAEGDGPARIQQALETLGHTGGPTAAGAVRGFLESAGDGGPGEGLRVRLAAIRTLGFLRDEAAVPLLSGLLEEHIRTTPIRPRKSHEFGWAQEPVHLAGAAAEALGRIGTAEAETRLITAFGKLGPFWYYTYRSGDHEWLKGCHSSIPHYRIAEALDAIGSRRAGSIIGELLRSVPMDPDRGLLYENDAYETVVGRVIQRAGAGGDVVDACLAVLTGSTASARSDLVAAVSASPPAVSVGRLSAESRAAQLLSVVCLRRQVAPRVREVLERYRRREPSRQRSWVCFFAARTLGKLRDEDSVPILVDILEEDPPEAAHGIPDPPNVFLHEAMTPLYRAAAADALGRIGAELAVPVLLKVVEDFDNAMDVRQAAASALGRVATPESLARLEKIAMNYPEVATRRELERACRGLRCRAD